MEYSKLKEVLRKAVEKCIVPESDLSITFEITKFSSFESVEIGFKVYKGTDCETECTSFRFWDDGKAEKYWHFMDHSSIIEISVDEALNEIKKFFEERGVNIDETV